MRYKLVKSTEWTGLQGDLETFKEGVGTAIGMIERIMNKSHQANGTISVSHLTEKIQQLEFYLKEIKKEEDRRTWTSEGLAKFVDILKHNNNELKLFYDSIISNIVKFLSANQGGLFIVNEDDENNILLELASSYAYDRKKYTEKEIRPGEGLIGQCFLEKEYIQLTEIPNGYTYITSGLGEATPGCLLIMPLIAGEKVVGVFEIASFRKFESFHIEFLQKLSENIASTIYNFKTNARTKQLLDISSEQTEHMKQQAEELQQNMEELTAMQEQLNRQFDEMKILKEELEVREKVFGYTTILSESDVYGTITFVNDKLCKVSKYSKEELIGKAHNVFRHPDMPKSLFALMWDTIKEGKTFNGIIKNKAKDGSVYWVDAVIVPIKDKDGKVTKYVGARYHITNTDIAEDLFEKQMRKIEQSSLVY